jgi:hypothetical protein
MYCKYACVWTVLRRNIRTSEEEGSIAYRSSSVSTVIEMKDGVANVNSCCWYVIYWVYKPY